MSHLYTFVRIDGTTEPRNATNGTVAVHEGMLGRVTKQRSLSISRCVSRFVARRVDVI